MIGYVTLGTNDLRRAVAFYEELLTPLGAKRVYSGSRGVGWSTDPDRAGLGVTLPYDNQSATRGNGTMVALVVDNPGMVDTLYKRALELGATDEGAPGPRGEGFYAAYFRDPDGNKLNFFCMT
ncbi:MAG: VOC family protein [Steroidobacteraceae bacterium]